MNDPIQKVWGTTTPLLITPMFEMHRLLISSMHRCSFHSHAHKHNAFYVLDGLLYIDSASYQTAKRDTVCLSKGSSWTVAPNVWHQFRTAAAGCLALEMYFTDEGGKALAEDILRANVGCSLGKPPSLEPGLWNGWRKIREDF